MLILLVWNAPGLSLIAFNENNNICRIFYRNWNFEIYIFLTSPKLHSYNWSSIAIHSSRLYRVLILFTRLFSLPNKRHTWKFYCRVCNLSGSFIWNLIMVPLFIFSFVNVYCFSRVATSDNFTRFHQIYFKDVCRYRNER